MGTLLRIIFGAGILWGFGYWDPILNNAKLAYLTSEKSGISIDRALLRAQLLAYHFYTRTLCKGPFCRSDGQTTMPKGRITSDTYNNLDRVISVSTYSLKMMSVLGSTYKQLSDIRGLISTKRAPLEDAIKTLIVTKNNIPHSDFLLTAGGTALLLWAFRFGRRRYKTATEIPLGAYRDGLRLRGTVLSVNDSDNLRVYHGRLLSIGRPKIDKQGRECEFSSHYVFRFQIRDDQCPASWD